MGNHGESEAVGRLVTASKDKTVDHSDLETLIWTRVEPVSSGVHRATLTNIQLTLGAASGKPVFLWTFKLDSGQIVTLYTSKRGEGARQGYEASKALGLSRSFSKEQAVGRTCQLEIDASGTWADVKRILPL